MRRMLTVLQLRLMAAKWLQACKASLQSGHLDVAMANVGYVIEFIVKARVCHDMNLAGFPETLNEFNAAKSQTGEWLKIHDIQKLINLTDAKRTVVGTPELIEAWSVCMGWTIETRYKPMGSATFEQVDRLILSAEELARAITRTGSPMTAVQAAKATGDPWGLLIGLSQDLAIEHGDFHLYALVMRSTNIDLIVSAPWIDPVSRQGAREVSRAVHAAFSGDPWPLGLVVALEPVHPLVTGLSFMPGNGFVRNTRVNGIHIDVLWKVGSFGGGDTYMTECIVN